jgi:hypothetical protein
METAALPGGTSTITTPGTGTSTTTSSSPTREQVLAAYANNPKAVLNPDEEAINYWMQQGLGNFNSTVDQVRAANPELAASIDAARNPEQQLRDIFNKDGQNNTISGSPNYIRNYGIDYHLSQDPSMRYVRNYGMDAYASNDPTKQFQRNYGFDSYAANNPNLNSGMTTLPTVTTPITEEDQLRAIFKTNYADGGSVKTHYRTAGAVTLPSGYGNVEEEQDFANRFFQPSGEVVINPVNMGSPPPPVINNIPTPAVIPDVPVANAPVDNRMANIKAMLDAYGPKDSAYGEDLKTARASAKAESDAFAKMLAGAMKSPEDEQSSKAEMYFRLAAAFGAPTRTGQFSENLSMVGKELADYSKGKRASAREKLALGLEAQKLKMTASKEDLNTLRALAGEEMKDKRTIATELLKDYIKSGESKSSAGKQAEDEGFKLGTPAFQKRVAEIGDLNIQSKLAQINASLAGVSTAQANLALNTEKLEQQKTQQAKLSPTELNMKNKAEDIIASTDQSLADVKKAYALNPNSLAGGWLDKGTQFLGEVAGSKDPKIVNTRILNNLLGAQGLAKLKATFGGAPTEGERNILMELEGIGSKTKEERAAIIKRTYMVLKERKDREQKRLDQINSGAYRMTTPIEGEIE